MAFFLVFSRRSISCLPLFHLPFLLLLLQLDIDKTQMRCSQLVLFALPLVGLAQGVAVRRDNDGHNEKHYEHSKE
jgi:hypothetical protein